MLEKNKLALQKFWDSYIVNYDEERVDCFKKLIIAERFPNDPAYTTKVEELFRKAIANPRQIEFDEFSAKLFLMDSNNPDSCFIPYNLPRLLKVISSGALPEKEVPEFKPTDEVVRKIYDYMRETNISAVVSLGGVGETIPAPASPRSSPQFFPSSTAVSSHPEATSMLIASDGNNPSRDAFTICSIGKIFTGLLVYKMLEAGIIKEADLNKPIELNQNIMDRLPPKVQEQLHHVTWHQLMKHEAGIKQNMKEYDEAILDRAKKGQPQIDSPRDNMVGLLSSFSEQVSPVGECRYSNAGMILIGFAIEHAYAKTHPEIQPPLDFYTLLQKHLVAEIGMPSFSHKMPKNNGKKNADHYPNYTDEDATTLEENVLASPAGMAWVTVEDLAKLGLWLRAECSKPDSKLRRFLETYGQESYRSANSTIVHPGAAPFASSYYSFSLKTGAQLVILCNQPCKADDLAMMIRSEILRQPNDELTRDNRNHPYELTHKKPNPSDP